MRNEKSIQLNLKAKFHATDHQVHCVSSSRAPLRAKIRHKLYFSGCNSLMKRGKLIYFFPAPFHNQLKRQRGGRFILKGVDTKREKSIKSHLTFFGVKLKLSCWYLEDDDGEDEHGDYDDNDDGGHDGDGGDDEGGGM